MIDTSFLQGCKYLVIIVLLCLCGTILFGSWSFNRCIIVCLKEKTPIRWAFNQRKMIWTLGPFFYSASWTWGRYYPLKTCHLSRRNLWASWFPYRWYAEKRWIRTHHFICASSLTLIHSWFSVNPLETECMIQNSSVMCHLVSWFFICFKVTKQTSN